MSKNKISYRDALLKLKGEKMSERTKLGVEPATTSADFDKTEKKLAPSSTTTLVRNEQPITLTKTNNRKLIKGAKRINKPDVTNAEAATATIKTAEIGTMTDGQVNEMSKTGAENKTMDKTIDTEKVLEFFARILIILNATSTKTEMGEQVTRLAMDFLGLGASDLKRKHEEVKSKQQ